MTNVDLAYSYMVKATHRIDVLELLLAKGGYSDVIREAQECVELACKAMLRRVGIDPPKWHDVGSILLEHRERFAGLGEADLERIASISKALRRDRELSFYGDIDFIPTEEYTREDAERAVADSRFVVAAATAIVGLPGP